MGHVSQKILVVEDNPVLLKLMDKLLVEVEGHHVLFARNGLEALELLDNFMPEVIFVDWVMEKISGEQFCKIIRSKSQFRDCYLVILTAMAAEAKSDLLKVGADACIAKGVFNNTAEHIKLVLRDAALNSGKDFSKTILGLDEVHQRRVSLDLLKRNKHYELVLGNIFDGVVVLSAGTRDGEMNRRLAIIFANQSACKIFGVSEEKLLASSLTEYFGDSDRNRLEVVLADIEDQPILIDEDQPLRVNDRYVSLACIPFVDSGEIYITCVLRDVTKQKKAEMELERSTTRLRSATKDLVRREHLLQSIATSAPVGINFAVDRKIYWSNDRLSEMTGYSAEELHDRNVRFLYTSDEEYERVGQEIYNAIEKYGTGATETQWSCKDGSVIDVFLNASRLDLEDSADSVTFTVLDISDQKKAERALRKSEQQLQLALEGADLGMWDWDIPSGSVYFSPGYISMLGYGPMELPHTLETLEDLLHPEDLRSTKQELLACLATEPSAWSLEFRLRCKDGGYRWILGRGQVVDYASDGTPLRAAGTHLDITDRKQAEFALKKSAVEWATAMDASDDAICLLDMERRILRANRVFCLMTGVAEGEIIGRHIAEIFHPQGEMVPCSVCRAQAAKKNAEIIMEADDPDNPAGRPIKVIVKIVQDAQNQPVSILMSIRDLTKQRQIEDSLRRSKDEWEKTFDSMSDIVTIQDRDMRIVRANRAAYDTLGADLEELTGQLCYRLFSGGSEPCPGCPELVTLNNLEPHSAIIHHDKLDKIFLVSSSPIIDDKNEVQYLVHVAKDITEQKRLEEQQLMLNSLLKQSNDAIYVIDPDSAAIIFANRKGLESLGYDQKDLARLTIHDIVHRVASEEDWQRSMVTITEQGFSLFETTHKRKDNSLFPAEVNARVVHYQNSSYIVAVVRDISERKVAEAKAFQEQEKLTAVVDALGLGLTFNDLNFRILFQNKVHRQQWGDKVGEFCYEAILGRDTICPDCQMVNCFEDGQTHQREYVRDTGEGTAYLEVVSIPFRDVDGKIAGGVETIRDITERKVLEFQVQQAQKMEAMGTLAGGIAHDFNNILAAIMGYNEMALQDIPVDNPVRSMLEHVSKGAERARDLVQQILTFSRKADQHKAPMLLQPVVKEVLKLLRATIPTTIAVKTTIAGECGLVEADPTMVHQLVMNLGTNAYHAMRETGGQLSVSLTPVTVDMGLAESIVGLQEGSYVQLTVSDTGHGMDASTLKRVFDPYFTTKAKGEGTGLGLAVVHGIVTELQGAITVTSEEGAGTIFQVFLPLDGAGQAMGEALEVAAPRGQGHILLVDDEEELTNMASLMLSRLGYQVTSFNSSSHAFEAFMKNPGGFDLIITDQTMPDLTGVDLAQRVLEIRSDMAILLMSGYSEQVDAALCRTVGISGYLAKPFKDYEIGEAIKMILHKV